MAISVNLTGVQLRPEPLLPGYYDAVVDECKQGLSKSSNQPTISWRFNVVEGPNTDARSIENDDQVFTGRKAFSTTSLQPQALFSLKSLLMGLGFDEEALSGNVDFEPSDMLGMPCVLVVVESVYNGKMSAKVDKVLEAGTVPDDLVEA